MNKEKDKSILPVIALAIAAFLFFQDKGFKLPNINFPSLPSPVAPVEVSRNISPEMQSAVQPVVAVAQASNNRENKKVAAEVWFGASDVWRSMGDVNFTTDKVVEYNRELLGIVNNRYPALAGSFPGFNEALNKSFFSVVGEDPKPITPEVKKQIADWSEAVGWAFTQ